MAIYQRDNINYGGMLGNAMANRANYLQRRYDRVAQMGQNWGNAIQQSGKAVQDAFNTAAQYQYNKDQLAAQQEFQSNEALKRAQEQLARQREQEAWQAKQNELNRQNTYDIALMNKGTQDVAKVDEWTKGYNVANAKLTQINAALNKNPNDEMLKYQKAMAIAEQQFYGNKLGINIPKEIEQPATVPATPAPSFNNADLTKNIDTVLSGTWNDANKAKANEYLSQIKDQALRDEYAQKIANKGFTVEERNAKSAAELAEARRQFAATGVYDAKKYRVKYSNGVADLVRK
jgi:hypothetical protein